VSTPKAPQKAAQAIAKKPISEDQFMLHNATSREVVTLGEIKSLAQPTQKLSIKHISLYIKHT